jgi:hypothetical protein
MLTVVSRRTFAARTLKEVDVEDYSTGDIIGRAMLTGNEYESSLEAYTPNSKTARLRVNKSSPELKGIATEKETYGSIDPKLLRKLVSWKPFQHYKRWVDYTDKVPIMPYAVHGNVEGFDPLIVRIQKATQLTIDGYFDESSCLFGVDPMFDEEAQEVVVPDYVETLKLRAVKALIPRVKTQVQLLNALWELKDFKNLRRTAARLQSTMLALSQRYAKTIEKVAAVVGGVSGSVADLLLTTRFAVEPLAQDIEGLHKALVGSLGRMKRLMQSDGIPQVSYYSRLVDEDVPDETESISVTTQWHVAPILPLTEEDAAFYSDRWETTLLRRVKTFRDEFHAQLRFVARWSDSQHRYAEQLGLIDALGLSFNLKHVWDAIPWSFLVDWVANVGSFLDKFSHGALDPILTILDYSWSVKREREIYSSLIFIQDMGPSLASIPRDTIIDYPVVRETAYCRQPWRPSTNTLILSGLTSNEASLAGALVVTRKPKLKKPKHKNWRSHLKRKRR